MSDNAKIFWTIVGGGALWLAMLWAAVTFTGCGATPSGDSYTKFPEGRYVRLQCYSPQGMVTGVVPREKLEQRIRLFDMPCILEGLDEPPASQPTAVVEPEPSPTKTARK